MGEGLNGSNELLCHTTNAFFRLEAETGRVVDLNHAAVSILGFTAEEWQEQPRGLFGRIHPDSREAFETACAELERGSPIKANLVLRWIAKDGRVVPLEHAIVRVSRPSEPHHLESLASDLTDRRDLEAQRRASQRLTIMGRVAAAVAHDLNNVLSVAMTTASTLQLGLEVGRPLSEAMEDILDSCRRGRTLTHELANQVQIATLHAVPLRVCDLARGLEASVRPLVQDGVRFRVDEGQDIKDVLGDPAYVGQALADLCRHRLGALSPNHELSVSFSQTTIDKVTEIEGFRLKPGIFVCVDLHDTGRSNDDSIPVAPLPLLVQAHLPGHEPRDLEFVRGLARAMKGALAVDRPADGGFHAKLWLPSAGAPLWGSEEPRRTVLVIDDDRETRQRARNILGQEDLTVLEADNGLEGIDVFRRHLDTIGLVLVDLVLPGLDGVDVLEAILEIDPEARVLVTSENIEPSSADRLDYPLARGFVHKPFGEQSLSAAVREALRNPA